MIYLFHKHDYQWISTNYSNGHGKIITQQCKCGKKIEVLFDSENKCKYIVNKDDNVLEIKNLEEQYINLIGKTPIKDLTFNQVNAYLKHVYNKKNNI